MQNSQLYEIFENVVILLSKKLVFSNRIGTTSSQFAVFFKEIVFLRHIKGHVNMHYSYLYKPMCYRSFGAPREIHLKNLYYSRLI